MPGTGSEVEATHGARDAAVPATRLAVRPRPAPVRDLHFRLLEGLNGQSELVGVLRASAAALARALPLSELWWIDPDRREAHVARPDAAACERRPLAERLAGGEARLRDDAPALLALEGQGGTPDALLALPLSLRGRHRGWLALRAPRSSSLRAFAADRWAELVPPLAAAIDRCLAGRALERELALWSSFFDALADPVLLVDTEHRITRANQAALEAAGAGELDPRGLDCRSLAARGGQTASAPCPAAETLASGAPRARQIRGLFGAPQGHVVSTFPLTTRDGALWGAAEIYRELADPSADADARPGSLPTVQLVAGVAHEVRNPLAAITNAVSLLRDGADLCDEDRELIDIVLQESRRVNRLMADLLAFSRPAPPALQPTDLRALVDSTLRLVRSDPHVVERVALSVDVEPSLPRVAVDPDRVRQVLWNLLLNAAQAMPGGGRVSVAARRAERDGRPGVVLEVEDEGPGIPLEERERAMAPFESRRAGGTGLGLALAAQTARAHRGGLDIGDARLGGARISLWLPLD